MRRWALSLLFGVLGFSAAAAPGKPTIEPMQFAILRTGDASCEPSCPEWLALQGHLMPDSVVKFKRVLRGLKGRKLPILLNSGGGHVNVGIEMGQLFRSQGLEVTIGKAELQIVCPPQGKCAPPKLEGTVKGSASLQTGVCASACTFALAGGLQRFVSTGAAIGVHQVTVTQTRRNVRRIYQVERRRIGGRMVEVKRTLVRETVTSVKEIKLDRAPEAVNRKIAAHLKAMGIAPAFFDLTMATAAASLRVLTHDEVLAMGIGTAAPPNNTRSFTGQMMFGRVQDKVFTAQVSSTGTSAEATVNLRFRMHDSGYPYAAGGLLLWLRLPDGPPVLASNDNAEKPLDPLEGRVARARLCALRDDTKITLALSFRGPESSRDIWAKTEPATTLLPLDGLRRQLCQR